MDKPIPTGSEVLVAELRDLVDTPFEASCCNSQFPILSLRRALDAAADMIETLTAAQQPVQEGGGEAVEHDECPVCENNRRFCANCDSTGFVPATAPPSAPVEAKARAMFEAQADKLAAPWDRQWEPTKQYWREKAHQALTQQPAPPSAPVGDFEDWLDRDWPLWRNNPDNPIIARLRRAWDAALTQQPAQAAPGGGAHCATCTCQPGMTPAVRYDLTPAQHEGVIRDHLISLGWTPPGDDAAGGGHD